MSPAEEATIRAQDRKQDELNEILARVEKLSGVEARKLCVEFWKRMGRG